MFPECYESDVIVRGDVCGSRVVAVVAVVVIVVAVVVLVIV